MLEFLGFLLVMGLCFFAGIFASVWMINQEAPEAFKEWQRVRKNGKAS